MKNIFKVLFCVMLMCGFTACEVGPGLVALGGHGYHNYKDNSTTETNSFLVGTWTGTNSYYYDDNYGYYGQCELRLTFTNDGSYSETWYFNGSYKKTVTGTYNYNSSSQQLIVTYDDYSSWSSSCWESGSQLYLSHDYKLNTYYFNRLSY